MPREPQPEPSIPVSAWWGLLVVLVLTLAVLPWWGMVEVWPFSRDGILWLTRGSSEGHWFQWVFASKHFIGFRPVTAISFTLTHYLVGWDPAVYRLTDLGLHAATAALIAVVATRITGRRDAWALLPAVLFLLHPISEDVVPRVARRSYSLSTTFGLASLIVYLDHGRRAAPWSLPMLACTALFAAAQWSNEAAYVLLPVMGMFALQRRGDRTPRQALANLTAPVLAGLVGLWSRWMIMGRLGGYAKHYIAFASGVKRGAKEPHDPDHLAIFGNAWEYAWLPCNADGRRAEDLITLAGDAVIALAVIYWLVVRPIRSRAVARERIPGLLFVWCLGYAMLYMISGNWFWRQGYPMVIPVVLALSWVAHDIFQVGGRRLLELIPLGTVLGIFVLQSPIVFGYGASTSGHLFQNRFVADLEGDLDVLETPTLVYLAYPWESEANSRLSSWLRRIAPDEVSFRTLVQGKSVPEGEEYHLIEPYGDGEAMRLSKTSRPTGVSVDVDFDGVVHLPLERLLDRKRYTYLYLFDEEGGDLIALGPPTPRARGVLANDVPEIGEAVADDAIDDDALDRDDEDDVGDAVRKGKGKGHRKGKGKKKKEGR